LTWTMQTFPLAKECQTFRARDGVHDSP
jgi:hypothetical protein